MLLRRRRTAAAEPVPAAATPPDPDWLAPHELEGRPPSPAPIGWYRDPADDSRDRLWDGSAWTEHVWLHEARHDG